VSWWIIVFIIYILFTYEPKDIAHKLGTWAGFFKYKLTDSFKEGLESAKKEALKNNNAEDQK